MTKYKKFMQAKGVKLEYDHARLAHEGIEVSVRTEVMDDCVVAALYSNISVPQYAVCNRYGECSYHDSSDYHPYIGTPYCDPEYIHWVYKKSCTRSFNEYAVMRNLYIDDEKVRIAFRHMKAGLMDESVFYGWLSDRYQKHTSFPAHS